MQINKILCYYKSFFYEHTYVAYTKKKTFFNKTRYSNEVTTTYKETPRTDPENKSLADLALRGLHLLSDWTSVVTELYSWKLLHPTDHHMNNGCPPEAEEYERVKTY
jgi:hypothetical protein